MMSRQKHRADQKKKKEKKTLSLFLFHFHSLQHSETQKEQSIKAQPSLSNPSHPRDFSCSHGCCCPPPAGHIIKARQQSNTSHTHTHTVKLAAEPVELRPRSLTRTEAVGLLWDGKSNQPLAFASTEGKTERSAESRSSLPPASLHGSFPLLSVIYADAANRSSGRRPSTSRAQV